MEERSMAEIQWHERLEPAFEQGRAESKPLMLFIWTPD